MLTSANRWILAGAWALILAGGALGLRGIARGAARDTEADRVMRDVRRKMAGAPVVPPPPMKAPVVWGYVTAEPAPLPADAGWLTAQEHATPRPLEEKSVPVLALYAVPQAAGSLDGVALTWTYAQGAVTLARHERAKDVAPAAVTVERRTGAGWTVIARLKPEATSWTDVEAPADARSAYRVRVVAPAEPKELRVTAAVGRDAEARTPSNRRARLVGGDAAVALLKVETYDRKARAWAAGAPRPVRPGEAIWPGGWTLKGLTFRGFRLVAEAAVGDGRTVELTTED